MMFHAGYVLPQLADVLQAQVVGEPPSYPIRYLSFDSRSLRNGRDTLFVALRGARRSGADYLQDAYHKGVRAFLADPDLQGRFPDLPAANVCMIRTANARQALQRLAAWHRRHFDIPVAAVTGSNGKTVIKEWLHQLMMADLRVVHNPKSYNSQIGVPLSVWQMAPAHEWGIFEAGISEPGEMKHLARIIQPTSGIFANIGPAHDAQFRDRLQKAREKALLFADLNGPVIYREDYPEVHQALREQANAQPRLRLIGWSTHFASAAYRVQRHAQSFSLHHLDRQYTFPLPFGDDASFENSVHITIYMLEMGWKPATLAQRLPKLSPVAQRLELRHGKHDTLLINDAYNADLESLKIALDFLQEQAGGKPQALILSDIQQSGQPPRQLYAAAAELLQAYPLRRVLTVGPEISTYGATLHHHLTAFPDTQALRRHLQDHPPRSEALLIKGARAFQLEDIARHLEAQLHETVLEINLGALARNLEHFRMLAPRGVKMMVMLKAFGYGSGDREIAGMLARRGVEYLAVAYADEGVRLREAGIRTPIMILNAEESNFETMIRYRLEPELYTPALWRRFGEAAQDAGAADYPVHLKLDTGMHRLGFREDELTQWLRQGALTERPLHVVSIYSHLAAADDPASDTHTRRQIEAFERMSTALMQALPHRPLRHILNTAGMVRFPEAAYDMVRLGLGLYGVDPAQRMPLEPISRLLTTVSQVKHLKAGDRVGYGRAGVMPEDGTIATLAIGYADGFRRSLSEGVGGVFIRGQWAPVIGRVCMDATMVRTTHIPEAAAGDEAVVFDTRFTVEELAQKMDTIPYEVLTGIGSRVKRIYWSDS